MLFQQFLSLLSCIQLLFPFFYFPNFFLQIKTKIKKQTAKDRAEHDSLEASSLSSSWHYIFVPPWNKGHCLSRWLAQSLSATNHILLSWQRKLLPGNGERVTAELLRVTACYLWHCELGREGPCAPGHQQGISRIFLELWPVKCRTSGSPFTSSFQMKGLIPPWPLSCTAARRNHELLERSPQRRWQGHHSQTGAAGTSGEYCFCWVKFYHRFLRNLPFNYWWSQAVLERQISCQIQAKAAFQKMVNSKHCLSWFVVHSSAKNDNYKT